MPDALLWMIFHVFKFLDYLSIITVLALMYYLCRIILSTFICYVADGADLELYALAELDALDRLDRFRLIFGLDQIARLEDYDSEEDEDFESEPLTLDTDIVVMNGLEAMARIVKRRT
jgi:hypothetical protein